jgi:tRNA dimethylallyltransferase
MDIGTAKPTSEEQARIPHHLIDIIDPDESFDAARFSKMAHAVIATLPARGLIPYVVGGTGLYIKSLLQGLFQAEPVIHEVRNRLKDEAALHGAAFLHKRLSECDPEIAQRIHPHDTYRIIRSLETYEVTGIRISKYHRDHRFKDQPFKVFKIGLDMDREVLYNRINRRVDVMFDAGFVDEVKELLERGYTPDLKSMQAIGYRHVVAYIQGRLSQDEALRTLKRDTRRYAKRQLTWFKADSEIVWIEPERITNTYHLIENFLRNHVT